MSDDKTKRGSPDNKLISLRESYEIDYWTDRFGVSAAVLTDAVLEAGNSVKKVERWLIDRGHINE